MALDAKTGEEVWVAKIGDINRGETITMAPFVVKGKVLVGNSGGEFGVRGWATALDENSEDRLAGLQHGARLGCPHRPGLQALLSAAHWPPDHWKIGGGTSWGWIQYDPDLNLIYYGSASPGPWNENQRPGDNLWATTIFARNPNTGQAHWAYQVTLHDLFDHDEINESIPLGLPIGDKTRKVLVHAARRVFMYVIDRQTGEVLSAEPYDTANAVKSIDLKTGCPIQNDELKPVEDKTIEDVCPAAPGTKDWQPSVWSPRTKLLYVPHQHLRMNWKTSEVSFIVGDT